MLAHLIACIATELITDFGINQRYCRVYKTNTRKICKLEFFSFCMNAKVSPPERRMQVEVIWEQHAEENIWTQEKQRNKEKEENYT
jgi:hypothetical protein